MTAFFKPGQLQSKQLRSLLIICAVAVPVIIFIYFLQWKTAVIYGDDLHQYITHEELNTIWDKLNMPVLYGKYRPVHGLVSHILMEVFKKHIAAYFLFNIGIQSLNTLIFAMLVNSFLRSPFLSLLFSLLIGLSRFAFYNITQLLNGGALEGLAMTFFLLSLFFITRIMVQQNRTVLQKQRDMIWAFVFTILDMYTHERYIMLIPFLLLLILLYPGLRSFSIKQKAIFCLIGIAAVALNIALKKYVFALPFLAGTGGQNISLSVSSIFTFLTQGILSIFQVNYGPVSFTGIKFTGLPIFDKILVFLLLGSFVTILVLYTGRVRKAFALKQKEEIAFFTVFLALGVLFFLLLVPAVVTIRLEQRWIQGSFSVLVLMTALAISRITFINTATRNRALSLFVLLFLWVNFSYLKNGYRDIYFSGASKIANSFKQAIDKGVIQPQPSKLYIWEKQKDEGWETAVTWAIESGYFFKFYQNKIKKVAFIDPSYKFDPAKTPDTTNERILYLNNAITDITSDYLRSPNLDFGARK